MSAHQSFMENARERRGRKAAKKPFAVECRYWNHDWSVWRRYERLKDAEKAVTRLPISWSSLKLEARLKQVAGVEGEGQVRSEAKSATGIPHLQEPYSPEPEPRRET